MDDAKWNILNAFAVIGIENQWNLETTTKNILMVFYSMGWDVVAVPPRSEGGVVDYKALCEMESRSIKRLLTDRFFIQ